MSTDNYSEKEVQNRTGWIRIIDGGARRYRSPGGTEISGNHYNKLSITFPPPQEIPEKIVYAVETSGASILKTQGNLAVAVKTTPPLHRSGTVQVADEQLIGITQAPNVIMPKKSTAEVDARFGQDAVEEDIEPANNIINIEPKVRTSQGGRPPTTPVAKAARARRATAKELSNGIYISLAITTSIVAMLTQFNDLAMTEMEAKSIAIPLGNILEPTKINERFGRWLADSGDYQLLGYALFIYISRVRDHVQARGTGFFNNKKRQQQQQQPSTPSQNGHQHLTLCEVQFHHQCHLINRS
jgi:hypothetical protein